MKLLQLSRSRSGKDGGKGGPAGGEREGGRWGERGVCRGMYSSCRTDRDRTQGEVAEKDWKKSRVEWKVALTGREQTTPSLPTKAER